MPTRRRKCPNCDPHEYQDKNYGRKVRIMNVKHGQSQRPEDVKGYKCTVCGAELKKA
jgi:hypothetical protein